MSSMNKLELGVFMPIGNNGFLMSKTAPQYAPSFEMNKEIAMLAGDSGIRLRVLDVEMARLRRRHAFLGFDAGIGRADDGAGRRDLAHRHHRDDSAGAFSAGGRRQDGRDDRRPQQRAARHQYRHRLVSRRIRADGNSSARLRHRTGTAMPKNGSRGEAAMDRGLGHVRRRMVPSPGLPLGSQAGAEAVSLHHLRWRFGRGLPLHGEGSELQLPRRDHARAHEAAEPAHEGDRRRVWPRRQDRDHAVSDHRGDRSRGEKAVAALSGRRGHRSARDFVQLLRPEKSRIRRRTVSRR